MGPVTGIFRNTEELSHYFAEILELKVGQTLPGRYFSIALSGGSTPKKVFEYISKEFKGRVDWDKLLIFWGDERCVGPGNAESNFRMAKESLLDHVPIPAEQVFRIKGEDEPAGEALRYEGLVRKNIQLANGIPQFDMVMLGLGDDGHTASIFPGNLHLFHTDRLFDTAFHPVTRQKRITVTGKVINNAKMVIFLVTGESKSERAATIIGKREGWEKFPAAYIQPGNGELIWLLDEAAATNLM
jgi:6-phosphogluconolactonase